MRRILTLAALLVTWLSPRAYADELFDTMFLTWFDDPCTTMTVQWLASDPRPHALTVVKSSDASDTRSATSTFKPLGDTGLHVQRVTFDGLEPGTDYRAWAPDTYVAFAFRTAPATLDAEKPLIFAQGGDLDIKESDVVPLHQRAASWDPLFAAVGGDLAYDNGKRGHRWVDFLRQWHTHMRDGARFIPLVACIGNHESSRGEGGSRNHAPYFYALFDGLFRDTGYATLDFGDYLSLILLDTGHSTPIAGAQTQWLARALANRAGRPHVLPVYHVPAYPSHRAYEADTSADIRTHWLPLFEAHRVKIAFEHRDHAYKRTHPMRGGKRDDADGIVYVGDGAWGRGLRDTEADRPYISKAAQKSHVLKVTLNGGDAQVQAITADGKTIDEFAR